MGIGNALLISSQVNQGESSIEAYFPPNARWFDWFSGNELEQTGFVTLETPLPSQSIYILPIHVRGGSILPLQDLNGTLTTKQQSIKPYQLLIALNDNNTANGYMCIDDGISIDSISNGKYTFIEFDVEYNSVSLQYVIKNNVIRNGYTAMSNNGILNGIKVFGLKALQVKSVNISPNSLYKTSFNATNGVLSLTEMTLTINKQFSITFDIVKSVSI